MVVYEFYPNGSRDKWLFGVGVLPWSRRLKIVKDVAKALSFLHSKGLPHKNMKTTSVFLDVSFRSLLGDYGFVLSSYESRRFEGAMSPKADVFEFGVFVLEVVSGRKRLEDGQVSTEEGKDLLDFAWRMHEVLEIGLLCTLNETKGRPCMDELVEFLDLKRDLPELLK
ncbi:L-type lectin-domain containing receptor kinase I.7 [Citrus sinensis]|nr:L-type lectin-domain containing receptor kinase I.7 [Citrus sinensis]